MMHQLINMSAFQNIVSGIFLCSLFIQLFYYLFFFIRPGFARTVRKNERKTPVSIIICARDEASNLNQHLPLILTQNYPDYEVVVVNDCSEDETQIVLEELQKQHKHLRISTIKKDAKFSHGKKFALFIGIKAAKNEWLLLTDADCFPESPGWLSGMQKNFTGTTDIVLGYGGYKDEPGFLNKYIRYDTVFIAIQYLSFAMAGIPYMGVGRNLAYRKLLFFENKGFSPHMNLKSGDDDLFVNKIAKKRNTKVEIGSESIIRSIPEKNLRDWIAQKKRHLSTGMYYRIKDKMILGGEVVSRLLFYGAFGCLLITWLFPLILTGGFLLRTAVQLTIYKSAMMRLHEKHLLLYSLIFDLISPFLNFGFYISSLSTRRRYRWK